MLEITKLHAEIDGKRFSLTVNAGEIHVIIDLRGNGSTFGNPERRR